MSNNTFWPRYPGDDSFGYDLRLHAFTLHGRVLSEDEVEEIARQKQAEYQARKAAHAPIIPFPFDPTAQ